MSKKTFLSRNAPCSCGSGKKYKRCCALEDEQKGVLHWLRRNLKWYGGAVILLVTGYLIFRNSNGGPQEIIYYNDIDIEEVDFSKLGETQKRGVLDKVNKISCTCGCGMTLVQCVAIDSTCPLRSSNIDQIRDLVKEKVEANKSS